MVTTQNTIGANAERARSHNRQMVLARLRQAGRMGRAEIARDAGLSTQAVSNIIADLAADGLIEEQGRLATSRGQPPVQYGLNPRGGFSVGIEIRPDAIFASVMDLCGATLATTRDPLDLRDLVGVTQAVVSAKGAILAKTQVPVDRLLGAGIVMPGPFGPTGLSGTGSQFAFFEDQAPEPWFAEALGLPVVVENDANAAAVAERIAGVASGLDTYAYLYFGNGLGLGIMQDGRLMQGAFGNAGEIGHIPIHVAGRSLPLETVLSRHSVQNHMARAGRAIDSSRGLAQAFTTRDGALMDWLEAASEPLSHAITVIENMLDPETIILGGAMPDVILDHMIATVTPADLSVSNRPGRRTARLLRGASGGMTGAIGAASLVLNRTFTPQISVAA